MSEFSERDRQFMSRALEQASRAARFGEVPVGAVVVMGNEVIAEACNQQITLNDPSAHAELLALRTAAALDNDALNPRVLWSEGLYADESAAQLKAFFKARRSLKA